MNPELLHNADEATLVRHCKQSHAGAQKILYTRYVEGMLILCLRYIPDREDAREAVMDGFLSCFKHIGGFSYQGAGSFSAWLMKIMVNQCLMYLRKRQPVFATYPDAVYNDYPDHADNALDHLNAKEIMSMIHALPAGCRTVFNLYVFEGMNHREIGELLGISDSTSKSQLHRARALLKETILQTS